LHIDVRLQLGRRFARGAQLIFERKRLAIAFILMRLQSRDALLAFGERRTKRRYFIGLLGIRSGDIGRGARLFR
jgi:hypothetical protein